jgi:ABC-type nitrate/sulfonate/bicarbonate transport system permease component
MLVRFPFALPAIFSGLKIAMTMAVISVIIGEFISANAGLGYFILYSSSRMETGLIFAALFVLCVIGIVLFGAAALAEKIRPPLLRATLTKGKSTWPRIAKRGLPVSPRWRGATISC